MWYLNDPESFAKAQQYGIEAEMLGVPLSHYALRYCLEAKEVASVLLGASSEKQLQENVKLIANQ